MIKLTEDGDLLRHGYVVALLLGLLCVGLVYQFTSRTPDAAERERAHIMIQRICDFERAYFAQAGTYLPINRETNGDVLRLNNAPGRFRYRVVLTDGGFTAVAEGDLDGDGTPEVWQASAAQPDPVRTQQD